VLYRNFILCLRFLLEQLSFYIYSLNIFEVHKMTDSIKIAVRVRPFNEKEINEGTKNIVEMEGQ